MRGGEEKGSAIPSAKEIMAYSGINRFFDWREKE